MYAIDTYLEKGNLILNLSKNEYYVKKDVMFMR